MRTLFNGMPVWAGSAQSATNCAARLRLTAPLHAQTMPRWTPRDDLAVLAAAQGRSGSTWPATVQLPDRGTISGGEARRRFWKLTHSGDVERRSATAGASVASATANNVTAGKRRRSTTSMEERAAAVGADVPPTPSKLRQIIADTGSSAAAKATAKIELHRHQKHVQKIRDTK